MNVNNRNRYTLDELLDAWQQQGITVDGIAHSHPITGEMINYQARRMPWSGWHILIPLLRAAASLAALAWLVCLYDLYVVDVLDLIPHIIIGAILFCDSIKCLRVVVRLLRHKVSTPPLAHTPCIAGQMRVSSHRRLGKATVAAAIAAVFLIGATPAYDGRSMSARGKEERAMVLALSDCIIANTVKNTHQ